jgi:hypothetical protein
LRKIVDELELHKEQDKMIDHVNSLEQEYLERLQDTATIVERARRNNYQDIDVSLFNSRDQIPSARSR